MNILTYAIYKSVMIKAKFVKGNYKLPPVVSDKPKPSVRIEGGDITIGGF